ncbi:lasso peptide biosynthesis B2 protein [Mycolicibacterium neoaurum]|uniref:lasso peptide biosynthesis B2 protein n=1 Tax=Mycolicibacterium neoaurum TaxID=1795 RepID=UPI0009EA7D0B
MGCSMGNTSMTRKPTSPLIERITHLRRSATGLSNYGWIVAGLPRHDLVDFHRAVWHLCRAVMLTTPTQTDLTALRSARSTTTLTRVSRKAQCNRERIAWLIGLARLLLPGAQCLPTAIATCWMLGDSETYLQVGVRRTEGDPFAHAWVMHRGVPLHCDSFGASQVFLPTWNSRPR